MTKCHAHVVHHESWKLIYFGVKSSKVTRHKNIVGVSVGFLSASSHVCCCLLSS